jgi:hypothetical protein
MENVKITMDDNYAIGIQSDKNEILTKSIGQNGAGMRG